MNDRIFAPQRFNHHLYQDNSNELRADGKGYRMIELRNLSNIPMSEAFEAARSENHHRVLALLHNVDAPGAALLRAKAWVRLGAYDRAIDECNRRTLSSYDAQEAVQLLGALAEALLEMGEAERVHSAIETAKRLAIQDGGALLIAYAEYCHAAFAFAFGDFGYARVGLAKAQDVLSSVPNDPAEKVYHLTRTGVQKRILDMQGWCYAQQGDYKAQEDCLIRAASESVPDDNVDHRIDLNVLRNLAAYVYRWPSPEGRKKLLEATGKQEWSPHTDIVKTRIRSALHNSERLFGYKRTEISLGSNTAPSLSLRLRDCVSALLVDQWKDRDRFVGECRFGVSLAFEITAAENPESDATDILELAAIVAPFDALIARRVLNIYQRQSAYTSKTSIHIHSPAAKARCIFVEGCLAKADRQLSEAASKFETSLQLSESSSGDYLSAIAGIENYSISRSPSHLEAAQKFAADFPSSNFSARLREALSFVPICAPEDFPYLGK